MNGLDHFCQTHDEPHKYHMQAWYAQYLYAHSPTIIVMIWIFQIIFIQIKKIIQKKSSIFFFFFVVNYF